MQADGDGKEAKWADIDDDEDDWAPETIEWNDGTKITLSQNDPAAVLTAEQAATTAAKEREEEQNRSNKPSPKPTTTVGPNATVLRLNSNTQPRAGGLVLKTPSEKATLVAKPSAPAPVRSPWAQLPPIDKVPPIPTHLPGQTPISRFQQNELPTHDSTTTPSSAAMEIPADSFTRTRRDTQSGAHGQLYNSQSGQYETVNSPRRGSVRKEQNFKPPSLLQRPSPNEQGGPAEPSAAFQTHRSGAQQDSTVWNRRASSTMSGDSGPQDRRASMSKNSDVPRIPLELLQQRRDSQPLRSPSVVSHAQSRSAQQDASQVLPLPSTSQSPTVANAHQVPSTMNSSLTTSPSLPKTIASGAPVNPHSQNDVEAQRLLMREKRELAIKRKKEEEEREEADKRERIRIKMETFRPPPSEKKEPDKLIVNKKTTDVKETEKRDAKPEDASLKERNVDLPQNSDQQRDVTSTLSRSPPKPPVLDASGAPKQYGLMKVHGPPLTNGIQPVRGHSQENNNKTTESVSHNNPNVEEPTIVVPDISPPKNNTPPIVNGEGDGGVNELPTPGSPSTRNQDIFKGPRQQSWKPLQNEADAYAGWNGIGMTTHSSPVSNLWGPPTNFKSLGNGSFERGVQRSQPRQLPYQENYLPTPPPQPIGPPRHLQRPREPPEPTRPLEISPASVIEDVQTIPTFPSSEPAPAPASRASMSNHIGSSEKASSPLQSNAGSQANPPANMDRLPSNKEQTRTTLAAWGNFYITSAKEQGEKKRQAAQEEAARIAEEERTGIKIEPQPQVIHETWRQVKSKDGSLDRKVVNVAKVTHNTVPSQQLNEDTQSIPSPVPPHLAATGGAGRGSRFFPGIGQGARVPLPRTASYTMGFDRASSPPPPESTNHPAYVRDQPRPLVNLPFSKPKPTVKLPPPTTTLLQSPATTSVQAIPLRAASQPSVSNAAWQDRFNGLLGKKPSPDKKFVHFVEFSATKVPLEVLPVQVSAAVSLPQKEEELEDSTEGDVTLKAIEDEEALFENREFGSKPTVLIPNKAPAILQHSKTGNGGKSQNNRLGRSREVDAETSKNLEHKLHEVPNGILLFIKLAGMDEKISTIMSNRRGYVSNHNSQRNRNVSAGAKAGKPFKPRESSGSYGSQKPAPNGAQRSPGPNGANQQNRSQYGKQNQHWGTNSRIANTVQ